MKLFIFALVCFHKVGKDVTYRCAPFYAFAENEQDAKDAASAYNLAQNPDCFDHDAASMEVPMSKIERALKA